MPALHQTRLAFLSLLVLGYIIPIKAADFELQDGDRVVMLGDGLIEQEQYSGWVELMMTTAFPKRDVTFRNLGWSGDTPAGDSRFGLSLLQAGREPEGEGWRQLQKQIELTKPTVIVFGYGLASAIEGGAGGIDHFASDFTRLLEAARSTSENVRFVFLSPLQSTDSGSPYRGAIDTYAKRIAEIAKASGSPYVDVTRVGMQPEHRKDSIHLNDAGYRELAVAIRKSLGWTGGLDTSDFAAIEKLRKVILRKSQWWFHRSRPANMAYVFGFRKHEQGQNATEIPRFDGLVEQEEQRIAKLRSLTATSVEEPAPQVQSQYAKFVEQPTPEFTIGDDFEVSLWAENPQLNKPIQINFDPEGRLWVASSEAYPMIEVGQSSPDKILVLEDTTGDGKADKSTVFADGLLIPTGVEPGDGGVYVAQSTDLLFLKDTDGDGVADQRTRVLSGFGTEDTHHNLHTLRWGYDGRLYMNQSIYTRTDAETPRGIVRLKAGGGFRYNTKSMRMQLFFRGLVNSWGHQFDAFGQSFLTDGAGFRGVAYAFPGATFNPTPGARRVLGLISPGSYPKFASMEIIGGDSFPSDWQGSIVTCDFRANRITRFSLQDDGAGFVTRQEDDILRTSASTFRPIDIKQGPDGALYIADWSNPIINHGEVDFRDERRDRWHGRIWRVAWKGSKAQRVVGLRDAQTADLINNLVSRDRFTREQSRRVLLERGGIQSELDAWSAANTSDSAQLQAMWMYQAIGALDKFPVQLLKSEEPRIRAAAVRAISDFADPDSDHNSRLDWQAAAALLSPRVTDAHPRVRLEAVRALGLIGTTESASLALTALSKPMDRFLDFALRETLDECSVPLMAAIESGAWLADSPEKEKQLEFILTSIELGKAQKFIAARIASAPISGEGPWIELIGKAGGRPEITKLWEACATEQFDPQSKVRAISALSNAARFRKLRPSKDASFLGKLIQSTDVSIKKAAIGLVGTWKAGRFLGSLRDVASQPDSSAEIRQAAINGIRDIGGGGAANILVELSADKFDKVVRQQAVVALASVDPGRFASVFFDVLKTAESEDSAVNLWRSALGSGRTGKVLATKVSAETISQTAARAGVRACKDGGRDEPQLLASLQPLTGLTMTAEKLTPEKIKELIRRVENEGNPGRGESVYVRKELQCINCHAIGGVGGKVGPDMTSLGASAPIDYIIESLFDPSAKIKEGYHAVSVMTEEGQVFSGIEAESTDDELVLRGADGKMTRIPQIDVVAKKPGKSLMPMGVIDRLAANEQIDLICFLTKLGKPGNYDASKGGVGRIYEVFAGTHRNEQGGGAAKIISGEFKNGWKPLLSRVNGNVSAGTLQSLTVPPRYTSLTHVYLRTRFDVSNDGKVTLAITGADKPALWIDGKRIEGGVTFDADLAGGTHTAIVRLDAKALPRIFKLTSKDVTFAIE